MSYASLQSQRSMALDLRRNTAYANALGKVVTHDSVVLDLGAGLGIHGLLAAKLGAKRIYCVEPEEILSIAREIAQRAGWLDRVEFLQGAIEEIGLPEQVDVIVSVFTGNFLFSEDLLPSLFYARDKYLRDGGSLIPSRATLEVAPVSAPEFYAKHIAAWSEPHLGLDFSCGRNYASHTVYYDSDFLSTGKYLARPARLSELDFHTVQEASCRALVDVGIEETGLCHGWAGWFTMKLGDTWLSTAPHEPKLHWTAAFLPLDPPITMRAGETVRFELIRPVYGDWTWRVKTSASEQQHSTFFALPLTGQTLSKASLTYRPHLKQRGEAVLEVLSHADGSLSLGELTKHMEERYSALWTRPGEAARFVRSLIKRYA